MAAETANIKRSRRRFGFSRIFIVIGLLVLLTILVFPGLLQVYDNTGRGVVQGEARFTLIDLVLGSSGLMEEYVISNAAFMLLLGMFGSLALTLIVWTFWLVSYRTYDSKWPFIMLLVTLAAFVSFIIYIDMVDAPMIWGYSYIPGYEGKFLTSFMAVPALAFLYLPAMALLWLIPRWRGKKLQQSMAVEDI